MARKTKIDEVIEKLSQRIAEGFYRPGERLPAAEDIAEELHVSRQTIRSALERLEAESRVDIRPSSGTYVCGPLPKSTMGPARKRRKGYTEQPLAGEYTNYAVDSGYARSESAQRFRFCQQAALLFSCVFATQTVYFIQMSDWVAKDEQEEEHEYAKGCTLPSQLG
jgi:DNA-binding GntR family transcriptional regulator